MNTNKYMIGVIFETDEEGCPDYDDMD